MRCQVCDLAFGASRVKCKAGTPVANPEQTERSLLFSTPNDLLLSHFFLQLVAGVVLDTVRIVRLGIMGTSARRVAILLVGIRRGLDHLLMST
jgi:hypothetical protein